MSDIIIVEEDDSDAWEAQLMLEKQRIKKREILHLPSKTKEQDSLLALEAKKAVDRLNLDSGQILEELVKVDALLDFIDRDLERIEREDWENLKNKQKKENETLQEMTEYLDRQPVIDDEVIDNE